MEEGAKTLHFYKKIILAFVVLGDVHSVLKANVVDNSAEFRILLSRCYEDENLKYTRQDGS